jgi:hypothetical protein
MTRLRIAAVAALLLISGSLLSASLLRAQVDILDLGSVGGCVGTKRCTDTPNIASNSREVVTSAWVRLLFNFDSAWSTFTPTITCGAGTVTSYTTQSGRYKILGTGGKSVAISINLQVNNIGTCSGLITVNGLPVINNATNATVLFGRDDSIGVMLQCRVQAAGNTCPLQLYDGTNVTATHALYVTTGPLESN